MFAGFLQDVFRMLRLVLWAWWNLTIISNEGMDLNDPKEFDDPQLVTQIWNHCKLKFVTVIAGCNFKLKTVPFYGL